MTPPLPRLSAVVTGIALITAVSTTALAGPSSAASPDPATGSATRLSTALGDGSGARVDAVARTSGLTAAAVRRLAADPTSHVDASGKVYVVEPPVPARAASAAAAAPAAPALTTDVFTLHSRPGAKRTILLDFNGHTIANTGWNASYDPNPVTIHPFDTDGNPGSFSTDEQAVILSVWQRVSEDYATRDVDVTTQEPSQTKIDRTSSTDGAYGTRLLFSPDDFIYLGCGCGGIAYVGVFNEIGDHDYYQPALVFLKGVGNDAKNMAEAASHEIGHNLGLSHDGTSTLGYYSGQGLWAPIMGVGYYRPLAQWSKGEYGDANNLEDDFAVMASHGAAQVKDDHGNRPAKATLLGATPLGGVIGSASDIDVFRVVHPGGSLSVSARPAANSPDLDVSLAVTSASGTVLASSQLPSFLVDRDVAGNLDASVVTTLPAGTYYVRVRGTGEGNPLVDGYSSYGSVGAYTVSTAVPQAS